ncbi:hypothetical protein QZH41_012844, partial [Actinostola sp. cb2023]
GRQRELAYCFPLIGIFLPDCNEPLILPGNTNLTSTSSRSPTASYGPQQALLHNAHAWCAELANADQHLEIDLWLVMMIKSMAIQGNPNDDEFTKTFSISYAVLEGHWLTYTEVGAKRIFDGNSNGGTVTKHVLKNITAARYVRFVPETWFGHVCARVQLYGCNADPFRALGMSNGDIPDNAVTASSNHSAHAPKDGRLHWTKNKQYQYWASKTLDANQWLQIDLSRLQFVTAIATQGRHGTIDPRWVKSYWFSYSNDGVTWIEYKENQVRKTFTGNSDSDTVMRHLLTPVIYARFVRFHPITINIGQV